MTAVNITDSPEYLERVKKVYLDAHIQAAKEGYQTKAAYKRRAKRLYIAKCPELDEALSKNLRLRSIMGTTISIHDEARFKTSKQDALPLPQPAANQSPNGQRESGNGGHSPYVIDSPTRFVYDLFHTEDREVGCPLPLPYAALSKLTKHSSHAYTMPFQKNGPLSKEGYEFELSYDGHGGVTAIVTAVPEKADPEREKKLNRLNQLASEMAALQEMFSELRAELNGAGE